MSGFTSTSPALTYKSILNVGSTANSVFTTSLQSIYDGTGVASSLSLSTTGAKITGDFEVTGTFALANLTVSGTLTVATLAGAAIGTNVQAYDADLSAIAGLSSTGLIARTGAGTASTRTLTGPAAGITVSNGDGVSGNPTLALANDLGAIEALNQNGILVRTGTDTWTARSINGDGTYINVTDGNGISGTPTVSLVNTPLYAIGAVTPAADTVPYFTSGTLASVTTLSSFGRTLIDDANASAARTTLGLMIGTDVQAYNAALAAVSGGTYTGATSITTLGTITTGTWNATTIAVNKGGTGVTTSTGTGNVVLSTSPTLVTPVLGAASATSLAFSSTSGIIGTTTNDNAAAGSVGEFQSATLSGASRITLTTGTAVTITSLSLTAGDWDLGGQINFETEATTSISEARVSSSATDNTLGSTNFTGHLYNIVKFAAFVPGVSTLTFTAGTARLSLASTTTVYLVARATFTVANCYAYGHITARRRR